MRIISFAILRDFIAAHPDSDVALRDWYKKTEKCNWNILSELKMTYSSADYVGNDRYVFNIRGNNYRLVAMVFFATHKVYIRWIGQHKDYDKLNCSTLKITTMAEIRTEKQYKVACARVEELLKVVHGDTPMDDKNAIELDLISDMVAEYEEKTYPIKAPSLIEVIKLRMYEMNLTQAALASLLGVTPSRISEYLSGKCEPTLKIARMINKKLNIDADVILG